MEIFILFTNGSNKKLKRRPTENALADAQIKHYFLKIDI